MLGSLSVLQVDAADVSPLARRGRAPGCISGSTVGRRSLLVCVLSPRPSSRSSNGSGPSAARALVHVPVVVHVGFLQYVRPIWSQLASVTATLSTLSMRVSSAVRRRAGAPVARA